MALDETKETQDVGTSGDAKETSGKTEETFTRKDLEKATSDALASAGRTAKSFEKREEAITKAEEKVAREKQEKYEAEKEAAKNDPDLLSAIERNRKASERKAELDERERKLNAMQEEVAGKLDKATKAEIKERAEEVATKHNVDAKSLVEFTDGSTEKMEELAKTLSKKGDEKTLKPDSGRTLGGENWRELSSDEKLRRALK